MSDEIGHGSLSKGPSCDPPTLFVQVMGKQHPDGQRLVTFERYRDRYPDAPATLEDAFQPTCVLHKWRRSELSPIDVHLEIDSEAGEPIRVPLFEQLWTSPRQPRLQHNAVQPVLPMALWPCLDSRDRQALPLRPGYLYVFYRDRLWRELEVSADDEAGRLVLRDIDLAAHRDDEERIGDDRRPAAGVVLEELWLPRRERERHIDSQLRIAYSEVQWSAARLNHLRDDDNARRTRCHYVNLSSANNQASPGMGYLLAEGDEQRLRLPLLEQLVAEPQTLTRDLAGDALATLRDEATRECDAFAVDGTRARTAADAGQQSGEVYGEARSPLYLQATARLATLTTSAGGATDEGAADDDLASVLWETPLDGAPDCLADARKRELPGLVIQDTLFDLRHALQGCRASLSYLQQIPVHAATDDFYECAVLVNQTILRRHDMTGEANPLRRFAGRADLSDDGQLSRILRHAQRALARHQLDAYQARLHALLLSREGHAVLADLFSLEGHDYLGAYALAADLLEALRDSPAHADALHDTPPTNLSESQRFLFEVLREGSGYSLHALLFPRDEDSPLDAPLVFSEDEDNPGDGRVRLKALAELSDLETPTAEDDVQLLETAGLAALASREGEPLLSTELKRWAGVVDLILGRLAEHAGLLFEQGAQQAAILPVARLARASQPALYGDLVAQDRNRVRSSQVILGVRDEAGRLHNGLTEHERQASQHGAQGEVRQRFQGAVRDVSGRELTAARGGHLARAAHALGEQHLTVLVADSDSQAAQLSRRARTQLSVAGVSDTIRLPYLITVFEIFNLKQELNNLYSNGIRQDISRISAGLDLLVASTKVVEFYGERHNRFSQVRTGAISRHLPLGDALLRSQSILLVRAGTRLKGTITAVNLAGVGAGAISAALLAWDAWGRFQHGNLGAGIALSLASAGTLVVTGTALFKTSPLWLGLGPVGWIALGLSLAAVLASLWLRDNDIEAWLRLGPFGNTPRYAWRNDPAEAFDRLVSLFAGIRIRIDAIGAATPQSVTDDSARHPAIGVLSVTRPAGYLTRLQAEHALLGELGPLANTRVVVNSNLPGLVEGWQQVARFRVERITEREYTSHREGYSRWVEKDRQLGAPLEPLFERATTDGQEYYLWIADPDTRPGALWRAAQRISCRLKVRVQWRKAGTGDNTLPRLLPAPGPEAETPAGDRLRPDFTRTGQPYWADETDYRDDEEHDG